MARNDDLQYLIDELDEPLVLVDMASETILELNQAARFAVGLENVDTRAAALEAWRLFPDHAGIWTELRLNSTIGQSLSFESLFDTGDERRTPVEIHARRSVRDGRDLLVLHIQDISGRKRSERELLRLWHHDPDSGLPDRGALLTVLGEFRNLLKRDPGPLGLLVIRIDGLDRVRAGLSAPAFRDAMHSIARTLDHALRRHTEFLARLDHERFAVALCQVDGDDAADLADRLRHVIGDIELPAELPGTRRLTATVGGTLRSLAEISSLKKLITSAELALKSAEDAGGDCVRFG